jgi:NADH-quinone oxidoreductase subunit C
MQKEQLKEKISNFQGEIQLSDGKQFPEVHVGAGSLLNLAQFLKTSAELQFDYLVSLSGVDYPNKLAVVYHLASSKHNQMMVVKVFTTDRENPCFDSVYQIWRTAEFHEREVFDLFGIKFNNHPDMRRLFLDENWQGYPLRKDYVDEINMLEL